MPMDWNEAIKELTQVLKEEPGRISIKRALAAATNMQKTENKMSIKFLEKEFMDALEEDTANGNRQACTKEYPCPKGDKGRWTHPDAISKGSHDAGDCEVQDWHCPICGLDFEEELAQ